MMSDIDYKDVPPDLVEAARLLARELKVSVYLTKKPSGGPIKVPGEYWGISLIKDGYDTCYEIDPDGRGHYAEQWT
jgi:hypothetical protein